MFTNHGSGSERDPMKSVRRWPDVGAGYVLFLITLETYKLELLPNLAFSLERSYINLRNGVHSIITIENEILWRNSGSGQSGNCPAKKSLWSNFVAYHFETNNT